jgi:hypothetical protein
VPPGADRVTTSAVRPPGTTVDEGTTPSGGTADSQDRLWLAERYDEMQRAAAAVREVHEAGEAARVTTRSGVAELYGQQAAGSVTDQEAYSRWLAADDPAIEDRVIQFARGGATVYLVGPEAAAAIQGLVDGHLPAGTVIVVDSAEAAARVWRAITAAEAANAELGLPPLQIVDQRRQPENGPAR